MGYTHYWTYPPGDAAFTAAWPQLCTEVAVILGRIRDHGIVITGPQGHGDPVLDRRGIRFNGDAATDDDYETFALEPPAPRRPQTMRFCKTARRPYDLAVTAVLLRARLLLPGIVAIDSDGGWDEEWIHGTARTAEHLPPIGARILVADLFGPISPANPFADTTI